MKQVQVQGAGCRVQGASETGAGDLPVEEILPHRASTALGRWIPPQVLQLLVDPLHGHSENMEKV